MIKKLKKGLEIEKSKIKIIKKREMQINVNFVDWMPWNSVKIDGISKIFHNLFETNLVHNKLSAKNEMVVTNNLITAVDKCAVESVLHAAVSFKQR